MSTLLAPPAVETSVGIPVPGPGKWRPGVAHLVNEEPNARLEKIARRNPRTRSNTNIVRKSASDLRVIRIDLE